MEAAVDVVRTATNALERQKTAHSAIRTGSSIELETTVRVSLIAEEDSLETPLLGYVWIALLPVRTASKNGTNAPNAQSVNISWKIHAWRTAHARQIKLSAVSPT